MHTTKFCRNCISPCSGLRCYQARSVSGTKMAWCELSSSNAMTRRCTEADVDPTSFSGQIVTRDIYCYVRNLKYFY